MATAGYNGRSILVEIAAVVYYSHLYWLQWQKGQCKYCCLGVLLHDVLASVSTATVAIVAKLLSEVVPSMDFSSANPYYFAPSVTGRTDETYDLIPAQSHSLQLVVLIGVCQLNEPLDDGGMEQLALGDWLVDEFTSSLRAWMSDTSTSEVLGCLSCKLGGFNATSKTRDQLTF